ncbi:MAG: putative metal-binding motif-containing protein, partial [Sandaracinaceae bacterium]|nr:putative metal-binding motif-containing protein [Sandaracinaceae bacterium]
MRSWLVVGAALALACGARTEPSGPPRAHGRGHRAPRRGARRRRRGGRRRDLRRALRRRRLLQRRGALRSAHGLLRARRAAELRRRRRVHHRRLRRGARRLHARDGAARRGRRRSGRVRGDCDDRDPRVSPRAPETCDYVDNDCDASTDEGVRSPCDDCRPGCNRVRVPGATGWDLEGSESAGVEVGPDGSLRLSTSRTETYFAWIANYLFGTITKLDTRTGAQSAEYDAALLDGTNGARPRASCARRRGAAATALAHRRRPAGAPSTWRTAPLFNQGHGDEDRGARERLHRSERQRAHRHEPRPRRRRVRCRESCVPVTQVNL